MGCTDAEPQVLSNYRSDVLLARSQASRTQPNAMQVTHGEHRAKMRLRIKPAFLRQALRFVLVMSLSIGPATLRGAAEARHGNSLDTPDEQQAYRINHCFNEGNREGYRDRKRQQSRPYTKKCSDREAHQAYDIGHQLGFNGHRRYRRDHRLSSWARPRVSQ